MTVSSESPPVPIPITIVTGFLGSGKTTLILNLIPQLRAASPSYRLALLKNEFGDLAVDSQLAASSAIAGVQELLGGCICCNLVGGLGDALEELRKGSVVPDGSSSENAERGAAPDRIIIETSGSAFPATLALEVNRLARKHDPPRYVLDGVVSVVDAENWKGYDDTSYTAKAQARYTDLIVLNKWEDVGERRVDEVLDRIGDLGLDTAVVKSRKGWVEMGVVFGVDGSLARELQEEEKHEHKHEHQSEVDVLSVTLKSSSGTAAVKAGKLMGLLRAAPRDEVYRIKAVLTTSSDVRSSEQDDNQSRSSNGDTAPTTGRYILNWAFGRWTFTPISASSPAEDRSSAGTSLRMTVILARYESTKWKKKLETGGFLEFDGDDQGELVVTKIA